MARNNRSSKPTSTAPVRALAGSGPRSKSGLALSSDQKGKSRLFDSSIVGSPGEAVDFITNILESSTEYSVIAKDLEGTILLWNEGARRLYGYEPDEVVGKANSSILHTPEDVRAGVPHKILQQALSQGKWEGTLSRRRKNGEQFPARVVITPRYDPGGKPIGFLLMSKDISEELRLTQYARSLIEASLDPLVTISPEGKITDVNEATVKVTGVPREKLVGTDFANYFTEPEKARQGYQRVFSKGFVTDYPLTIRHVEGRLTDVLYNASVYKDAQGEVLGVFAAARDISERRRAEEVIHGRARQQAMVAELGQRALAGSDLQAFMDEAVHGVAETLGVEYCKVLELLPDGQALLLRSGVGWKEGLVGQGTVGAGLDSQAGYTLLKGEPVVVEDLRAEQRFSGPPLLHEHGVVSGLSVTIPGRTGPYGVLGAHTTRARKFTRDDVHFLQAVANVLAAALQRKQSEAEVSQANAYNRSLIEASLDPLVTVSPEGKITDVNEATVKVTGVPRQELVGTDVANYFTEPERARQGYQLVFSKGFVTDYPLTLCHVDGRLTDVMYNASVYKDAQGKVLGLFAAARNVTALKEASQYARSLIEASLDPLVTVSPEGKVTDVNEATVKVTGVPREKLIGTDVANYFTEPEKARQGYQLVFSKGFVTDYPLTFRHVDGRLTDVMYNASVYRDAQGKVIGLFAAARDVTALKRTEAELADQRARELERLAELERFHKLTIGRELKMIELKKEIEELKQQIPGGGRP